MTNNFRRAHGDHDAECGRVQRRVAECITLFGPPEGRLRKESFFTKSQTGEPTRYHIGIRCTDLKMTQAEHAAVKIDRKIGPGRQTLDAWRKIAQDAQEIRSFWPAIGKAVMLDYLNTPSKPSWRDRWNDRNTSTIPEPAR